MIFAAEFYFGGENMRREGGAEKHSLKTLKHAGGSYQPPPPPMLMYSVLSDGNLRINVVVSLSTSVVYYYYMFVLLQGYQLVF